MPAASLIATEYVRRALRRDADRVDVRAVPGVNRIPTGALGLRVLGILVDAGRIVGGAQRLVVLRDPPSVMEFTWGTDLLRIELEADGAGTVLTLTDTFDDVGKAARDAVGWHECLDLLASDLDGTARPAWGETWRRVHPAYVTALGPEAAAIGPPPGWEEHVRAQ